MKEYPYASVGYDMSLPTSIDLDFNICVGRLNIFIKTHIRLYYGEKRILGIKIRRIIIDVQNYDFIDILIACQRTFALQGHCKTTQVTALVVHISKGSRVTWVPCNWMNDHCVND